MEVIKRNGKPQPVHFDKITERITTLKNKSPPLAVDAIIVAQKVVAGLFNGILTTELDVLAAETAASMTTIHPDYEKLAVRILISNLHKETKESFMELCDEAIGAINPKTKKNTPLINEEYYRVACENDQEIQAMLDYERDYQYDYFGLKTMMKSYLLKIDGKIIERPQHMIMRVALAIHGGNMVKVRETYNDMSLLYYTHATPTLFNAGSTHQQLASCFLLDIDEDSVDGIYKTLKDCAKISQGAGGIGIAIHKIRSDGAHIKGNNGESNGIIPMLRVFNDTAKYINQGSKRNGSIAIYLEPHHPDIESFLDLRKNTGDPDRRCRDLFLALWTSNLFMKRVKVDQNWSLFDPDECPGLHEVYGSEYEELYHKYESEGRAKKTISAQSLWRRIITSQIETGTPYMLYKDTINEHNNQSNLGTIKSSNLCVSGDTRILTSEGQIPIKELVDKQVEVWNGECWSNTVVRKTGENQELLRVVLSNGAELNCTHYHKFHLIDGEIRDAAKLRIGDKMITYKLPLIRNNTTSNMAWLNDYCASNASMVSINSLRINAKTNDELVDIRLRIQELGVDSKISGKSLKINSHGVNTLMELGLNVRAIPYQKHYSDSGDISGIITVSEISLIPLKEDTYCFNEPLRHMGMFNGILTGNCTEICEYTSKDEIAVCNLASVSLKMFIENGVFNHQKLYDICYKITENLNNVIDITRYPVIEAEKSNLRHRPIGIGMQGLADTFILLRLPFDSLEAKQLNREIAETMYFAAASASCDLARKYGYYASFKGSPASHGRLMPDLWDITPTSRWNFGDLREAVVRYGMRNSLLMAPMPTASTASILGNIEAFEPISSNLYSRNILAGTFTMLNKYLVNDLIDRKLWNLEIKDKVIANNGSIQGISEIPKDIQLLYRTAYELSMRDLIDMCADRSPFICQSQSFNVFMAVPNYAKMTSMHFYGWEKKLKSGMYYLRTKSATNAIKFTLEVNKADLKINEKKDESEWVCTMEDGCISCGS